MYIYYMLIYLWDSWDVTLQNVQYRSSLLRCCYVLSVVEGVQGTGQDFGKECSD